MRRPDTWRRLGDLVAEVVENVAFCCKIERLCGRPRSMTEMVAEVCAEYSIRKAVENKIDRYLELIDEEPER